MVLAGREGDVVTIDDLPNSARRALAARSMLAVHGFTDDQVFIGLGLGVRGWPSAPGTVHLAIVIACDGNPLTSCDFLWPVGPIDTAWWVAHGPLALIQTWNGLTPAQRLRERNRWITPEDEIRLTDHLRISGLLSPISPSSGDDGTVN